MLDRFSGGDPPFLISSTFPYREDEDGPTHFLPRPLLRPAELPFPEGPADADRHKRFRKQRWVTEEVFRKFVTGALDEAGYYRSGEWEDTGPSETQEEVLHNTIDRLGGSTGGEGALYSLTERSIQNGGLYFLLDGDLAEVVEGALSFLSHFGIGGDSALGKGRFDVQIEEASLFDASPSADRFVTLSLYAPQNEEIAAFRRSEIWYDLTVRKGKVGGPFLQVGDFWKRSLTMFVEGSVFPALPGVRCYGQNPIVKGPEDGLPFQVQHYGFAFHVPVTT